MHILGGCHCGNISFSLAWEPAPTAVAARACGCSFCTKHGGVWTSNPNGALQAKVQRQADVSHYAFGTRSARFHICKTCGVVPFVTSEVDGATYAVVNVNTFCNLDPALLVRAEISFEGEDLQSRLQRRKRGWIASVQIDCEG